jgi:hypothetical protein
MLIKRGGEEKIISVIDDEEGLDDAQTADAFKAAKESVKKLQRDGNKTESDKESVE